MRHSTRIWLLLAAGALLAACNPHEFPIGDGGDPARDFSVRLVFEEDMEDLAVNGRDLMAAGLKGKAVGEALQSLLEAVMDGRVPNEKEALMINLGQFSDDHSGK